MFIPAPLLGFFSKNISPTYQRNAALPPAVPPPKRPKQLRPDQAENGSREVSLVPACGWQRPDDLNHPVTSRGQRGQDAGAGAGPSAAASV